MPVVSILNACQPVEMSCGCDYGRSGLPYPPRPIVKAEGEEAKEKGKGKERRRGGGESAAAVGLVLLLLMLLVVELFLLLRMRVTGEEVDAIAVFAAGVDAGGKNECQ